MYLKGAKFYIMKSQDSKSIETSQKEGIWSTTFGPTKKLSDAYKNNAHVVLIFSINESGGYQGFAMMKGAPSPTLKPHLFKRTAQSPIAYQDNFPVEWRAKGIHYHFKNLNNFPTNPLNRNTEDDAFLTIMQSKNCQEIPFKHGNYLVQALLQYQDKHRKHANQPQGQ